MITTRKTQARVDGMCLTDGCQSYHLGEASTAWAVAHVEQHPGHLVSVTRTTVDLHYVKDEE